MMGTFVITGPDGKKYKVTGDNAEGALQALRKSVAPQETPPQPSGFNPYSLPSEAMDMVTGGLQQKLNAAGIGLIDATMGAVQGKGWDYSGAYNRALDWQRGDQERFRTEHPVQAGLGQAAGIGLGITSMPVIGNGVKGALGTGAVYGGAIGAGQDADSLGERVINAGTGALTGAGIGGVGYLGGKAIGAGATKLGQAWNAVGASPETRAAMKIGGLIDDQFGPNNSMSALKAVHDLGPDASIADVLGEPGRSVARSAANVSPEARETLEGFTQGRKSGQNQRIASDIETASGLPIGNRKTVDVLKKEANDAVRPHINRAYQAARKAGEDVPLDFFKDVLDSDAGGKAFQQAFKNVSDRMATGKDVGGNLAVIDETKRILDGWAKQGYRNSDPMASVYDDMAKHLRFQMDAMLNGGEYSAARALRKAAYKKDEAFDLGSELAQGRVPLDAASRARKVGASNEEALAKGYGAQKVENILNKNATEGALNEFTTPMGREAMVAALKGKSGVVEKGVGREKTFERLNKALVGNSTTARQLAEIGGSALSGAGAAAAFGYDATTGGIAGALASLGRRGVPALSKKLATDMQRKTAPIIAQLLTGKNLPPGIKVPSPTMLERLSKADKDKLLKALLLGMSPENQKTSPQTNPAN